MSVVLQDELVFFALLPVPPKTWVTRVPYLHPAYVEIALALEDADNPPFGVSDHGPLCVEGDCVLCLVAYLAHRQEWPAHVSNLPSHFNLVVLPVFEWGKHF